jgi:CBS-domain-containing membrane protein
MIVIGLIASLTLRPFIFPSLGPTAMMQFANPLDRLSSPRHVLLGHFTGAAAGYAALAVSPHVGITRVIAAAVALALTAGTVIALKVEHPPAGATTLIVALGILPQLEDFLFLMAAVVLLTALAVAINRVAGIPYPLW